MTVSNLSDLGRTMSGKQVAEYLGLSLGTVYRSYQELGGIRVGQRYVFFERRFLEALEAKLNGTEQKNVQDQGARFPELPDVDVNLSEDPHGLLAQVG